MHNDITQGLRVPTGIPLDSKAWVKSKSTLTSYGDNNNLAYTYYKGLRVYCAEDKEIFEWMPVSEGNALKLQALSTKSFTYPNNYIIGDINYSLIEYNFFLIPQAWDIQIPDIPKVPGIVSIGDGTKVYKGLNSSSGNHEFHSIGTKVIQPIPQDNQILGEISAKSEVKNNQVQLEFDFSKLKVPLPKTEGIPEYYVHNAADESIADGSIVRPYRTWEACKAAIIDAPNGGTFWKPVNVNARVIFQTGMQTSESLTVNRVVYRFENNSIVTYTGNDYAFCDMQTIINAVPKNPDGTATYSGSITFEGFGGISRNNNPDVSKSVLVRAAGYSMPEPAVNTVNFTMRITSGTVVFNERPYDSNYFENSFEKDGAGRDVYYLKKTNNVDNIPATAGLLHISNRNRNVRDCFYVDNGANLNINVSLQRAIFVENEAGLINYGNILIQPQQNLSSGSFFHFVVRYGSFINSTGNFNKKLSPSDTVALITIRGGSNFNTSSTGTLSTYVLGSTNEGGYNAFVELENNNSSFSISGKANLSIASVIRLNYIFFFRGAGTDRYIGIQDIFSNNTPYKSVFGSSTNITTTGNNRVGLNTGRIESNATKLFDNNNINKGNVSFGDYISIVGRYAYGIGSILDREDQAAAIDSGLVSGMLYRTGSTLKIVY